MEDFYGIIGFAIVDTQNYGRTMMMGVNPAEEKTIDYGFSKKTNYSYLLNENDKTKNLLIPNAKEFYSKYVKCAENGEVTYINFNDYVLNLEKVNGEPTNLYIHKLYFEPFNRIENPWNLHNYLNKQYFWNKELSYEDFLRKETEKYYENDPEAWESFITTMKSFSPKNF